MGVKITMTNEAVRMLEDILSRGNDAAIRRKGHGYIIMEERKTIKYRTEPIGAQERAIGANGQ